VTAALFPRGTFKRDAPVQPMQPRTLGLITLRRETGARYARIQRLWVSARNLYRRLHAAPVQDIAALRAAAERLDELDRGRAALRRDLKALAD
jgi:hypothetical protein